MAIRRNFSQQNKYFARFSGLFWNISVMVLEDPDFEDCFGCVCDYMVSNEIDQNFCAHFGSD